MFKKGDHVVKNNNGICKIADIVRTDMGAGEKEYYVLIPLDESTAKVFLPVDIAEKRVRTAMNKDDAWRIIKEISAVDETFIDKKKVLQYVPDKVQQLHNVT